MAKTVRDENRALLKEFADLPDFALIDERMAAAVRNCSVARIQRERFLGVGPEFIRDGRSVRYRKSTLSAYIEHCVVRIDEAGVDAS